MPEVIKSYGKRVLLTYGGGSIKRLGIYDKVHELLKDCEIIEYSGITPNPKIDSVREGVALCKKNNIDVILAVGGGSAPIAIKEPNNYEARGQLMWGSTIADNATLCNGNMLVAFSCHGIEHELSAYYDVTHGVGLAIITPRWMEYVLSEKTAPRFAHFGKEIFGVSGSDDMESAKLTIKAVYDFFKSLGVPMNFTELGIGSEHFDDMAKHAVETEGLAYAWIPLEIKDVKAIFEMCL